MTTIVNMKRTKETINLQPAHVKAYRFVEKYIAKNIVAPEMEEISKGIKLTLRHTYRVVEDLCVLGFLEKELRKRRSIRILKPLQ